MKNPLQPYCLAACVLAMLFQLAATGRGETITWTAGNGNWNDPANWNPPFVPGVKDTAVIIGEPKNIIVVVIDDAEAAYSLTVELADLVVTNGARLQVNNVTVGGSYPGASIEVAGGSMEAGTTTVESYGGIGVAAGLLQTFDVSINGPYGGMGVTGGTLQTGTVTVNADCSLSQGGGQLINVDGITNEYMGTVSITGDFSLSSELLNYGTLSLEDGSILLWNDGSEFNGEIYNDGIIELSGSAGDQIVNFYGTEFFQNFGGAVTVETGTEPVCSSAHPRRFKALSTFPRAPCSNFRPAILVFR